MFYNQTILLTIKRNSHLCAPRDMYGDVDASVSVVAKPWEQMSSIRVINFNIYWLVYLYSLKMHVV